MFYSCAGLQIAMETQQLLKLYRLQSDMPKKPDMMCDNGNGNGKLE